LPCLRESRSLLWPEMPIIYSLVARGTCVLAEYTNTSGNFTTVTRRILEKLSSQDARMSYAYDKHIFHYMLVRGLVFLCMAEQECGRRVPFAFLEDVMHRWYDTYGERGQTALAYGMNAEFQNVLRRQMDFYARDPTADISRVQNEIEEVRQVMVENIEQVLERGEKIELLVDKTEEMSTQALRFKKQTTALKRTMCWRHVKLTLLILFILLVAGFFAALGICGGFPGRCWGGAEEDASPPPPARWGVSSTRRF